MDTSWQPPRAAINPHIYVSELDIIQYPPQAETNILAAAVQAEVARCMKAKGFELDTNEPGFDVSLTDDLPEVDLERVYTYFSPQSAAVYGTSSKELTDSNRVADQEMSHPSPYIDALLGPAGTKELGCKTDSKNKVLIHRAKMEKLFNQIAQLGIRAENLSKPYQKAAEKKWAACMAAKGLPSYRTVEGLFYKNGKVQDESRWSLNNHTLEEIHVATVSGKCMVESGYLEAVSKFQAQAVHTLIAKKPGVITEWQKLHKEQVEHAKKQLAANAK